MVARNQRHWGGRGGGWEGGGRGYKKATGGILVLLELISIFTVRVITATHTGDEPHRLNAHMQMSLSKAGDILMGSVDYINVNILVVLLY